mgnify:CR=1 FL=1
MEKKIGEVLLSVDHISLAFGGVKALTDICFDIIIKPAHVPQIGIPSEHFSLIFASSFVNFSNLDIVVLSPPGITRPLMLSISDIDLTSQASTLSFLKQDRCS